MGEGGQGRGRQGLLCPAALDSGAELIEACRLAVEDHRLGLEEVVQALAAAFAADAGLLEAAERDREVGAPHIVPYGPRADSAGDPVGVLGVVGEQRGVGAGRRVVGDRYSMIFVLGGYDPTPLDRYCLAWACPCFCYICKHRHT